ncbi:hypothetical protein J1605_004474 [Eschrichtius robustus]|uniref:Uncharacterized protein n=1 Tax=Eschrichtius robustus TaxID=9764 RepID=A0AB34HFJ4_ESCRO|nr:hypothetical protein J1605_004474 [Eschrichtius robustus]
MATNSNVLSSVCSLLPLWVALRDLGDSPFQWTFMYGLTLSPGVHDAFGKLQGTVARVHIGQGVMSICTKLQNKEHVIEALHKG